MRACVRVVALRLCHKTLRSLALWLLLIGLFICSLVLEYRQGIQMLHDAGYMEVKDGDDLTTEAEKFLGKLVKQKVPHCSICFFP